LAQEKWMIDGEKTIDIESVRRLKVALIGGQVDIIGHDEPGVRVEVHSVNGKPLKVSVDGDTLEIDHPQLNWDNFIDVFMSFRGTARADVSIMVPRDITLKFGVVSAKALITGLTTDARISTVSGDVVVDDVSGDLELNAVNGELSVRNHEGNISSRTVSGDVTVSGEISKFHSDAVAGNVFLDVIGSPDEVKVKSVSGNVTVRLAAGVAAQYKVNTIAGRLQVDDSEIKGIRGQYTGKFGQLDGRWLDFSASTVSGNIAVLHGAGVSA